MVTICLEDLPRHARHASAVLRHAPRHFTRQKEAGIRMDLTMTNGRFHEILMTVSGKVMAQLTVVNGMNKLLYIIYIYISL